MVFEGIATADGYNEYLEERLKTGKGDDIFIVNEDSVKTLAHNGHFYDLSSLEAFEKLNDSAREEAVIRGYGILHSNEYDGICTICQYGCVSWVWTGGAG